jgi:hypothetical protein
MNINDLLARQQKMLDKAKTGMTTRKIAQADIAQPIDPNLITIQTVFENVKGTGSSAATAVRYQAAIAQRAPQIAQLRQGVSQDASLKAAVNGARNQALKRVTEALRQSGALQMPEVRDVQIDPMPQRKIEAAQVKIEPMRARKKPKGS